MMMEDRPLEMLYQRQTEGVSIKLNRAPKHDLAGLQATGGYAACR